MRKENVREIEFFVENKNPHSGNFVLRNEANNNAMAFPVGLFLISSFFRLLFRDFLLFFNCFLLTSYFFKLLLLISYCFRNSFTSAFVMHNVHLSVAIGFTAVPGCFRSGKTLLRSTISLERTILWPLSSSTCMKLVMQIPLAVQGGPSRCRNVAFKNDNRLSHDLAQSAAPSWGWH